MTVSTLLVIADIPAGIRVAVRLIEDGFTTPDGFA
jgi:hypothetical protein